MYQLRYTALIFAALNGHLSVVEYLVDKGADMETKDEDVGHLSTTHLSHNVMNLYL